MGGPGLAESLTRFLRKKLYRFTVLIEPAMVAEPLLLIRLAASPSVIETHSPGVLAKPQRAMVLTGRVPTPTGRFTLSPQAVAAPDGQLIISYYLAGPATVRLSLFDLRGRKVLGVIRRGLGVGQHSMALNLCGSGLTNRQYTYQLHADNAPPGAIMTDAERPILIKSGTICMV